MLSVAGGMHTDGRQPQKYWRVHSSEQLGQMLLEPQNLEF